MSSYELADNIIFFNTVGEKQVEVLRISKEGITANPDVPVDEAAQAVIRALNGHIQQMVEKATKCEWVNLEPKDMPDGEDQMYDHPFFTAGMVWAANKLKEKNT